MATVVKGYDLAPPESRRVRCRPCKDKLAGGDKSTAPPWTRPSIGSAFGSASCSPALRIAPSCSVLLRLTCANGRWPRRESGGDCPYKREVPGSKPGAPTQVRGLFASSREQLMADDWLLGHVSYGQVSARQPRSGEVRSVLGADHGSANGS